MSDFADKPQTYEQVLDNLTEENWHTERRLIEEHVAALGGALELIDRRGCEKVFRGRCWDVGKWRGAQDGADAWCAPCIARDALEGTA